MALSQKSQVSTSIKTSTSSQQLNTRAKFTEAVFEVKNGVFRLKEFISPCLGCLVTTVHVLSCPVLFCPCVLSLLCMNPTAHIFQKKGMVESFAM